jgi:hypothetical protein
MDFSIWVLRFERPEIVRKIGKVTYCQVGDEENFFCGTDLFFYHVDEAISKGLKVAFEFPKAKTKQQP